MRQPGLGAKTKKMKRWLLEFYVTNKMISDEARALELLAQKMDELEKRVAELEAHQPVYPYVYQIWVPPMPTNAESVGANIHRRPA